VSWIWLRSVLSAAKGCVASRPCFGGIDGSVRSRAAAQTAALVMGAVLSRAASDVYCAQRLSCKHRARAKAWASGVASCGQCAKGVNAGAPSPTNGRIPPLVASQRTRYHAGPVGSAAIGCRQPATDSWRLQTAKPPNEETTRTPHMAETGVASHTGWPWVERAPPPKGAQSTLASAREPCCRRGCHLVLCLLGQA